MIEVEYWRERGIRQIWKNLDKMRQDGIGEWLLHATWKERDKFDEEVSGFHIFNNNDDIGERGEEQLWKGVEIILQTKFYQAWKDVESLLPP